MTGSNQNTLSLSEQNKLNQQKAQKNGKNSLGSEKNTGDKPTSIKDNLYWQGNFIKLMVITSIFRLAFMIKAELKYEEAYYWCYSQHLSLSYYDHPPMVGWLIKAFSVFGDSELWVRMPALLLFVGTMALLYHLTADLFNHKTAFIMSVMASLLPAFEFYSMIIMPDIPLMFFWSLGMYAGYRLLKTQNQIWWIIIGIATGLGMLSKYPGILIPFIPILVIVINKRWFFFKQPYFYLAIIISLALFSPVIIWNAQHEWVSLLYQGTERFAETRNLLDLLGGTPLNQSLVLSPGGVFLFVWLYFSCLKKYKEENYQYLLAAATPLLALGALTATTRMLNMNWLLPVYLSLIILLAARFVELKMWQKTFWRIILALVFIPSAIMCSVPWIGTFMQVGELNRINDFVGWKNLVKPVNELRTTMPDYGRTFIMGDSYQTASELAYYIKDPALTECLTGNEKAEKGFEYWFDHTQFKGWDAIFVTLETLNSKGEYDPINPLSMKLINMVFDKVVAEDKITVFHGGKPLRRYRCFRCYGYKAIEPELK